ncbi:type-2 ice-structuring protein-like [Centropristis striata]|uniref:type-2 ice-structuring protein-like n=1 Tax=Centropristis striata TaxID=184440 RepID=UPI0027E1A487|nr:type-2 ice-structuring protein-like [Centropristis striata]
MLSLALLVCAMMALTRATAIWPVDEEQNYPEGPLPTLLPTPADIGLEWHPHCPDGWVKTPSTIQCLRYVAKEMTWSEAESNCYSLGGNLASAMLDIQPSEEFLDVMKKGGQKSGQVWVGGYNTAEDPRWQWSDLVSYGFDNWCSGGPDNRKNHCVQLTIDDNKASGCLDDRNCDTKLPSICGIIIY